MQLLAYLISFVLLSACGVMGKNPSKQRVKEYSQLKYFDKEKEVFKNRRQKIIKQMAKRNFNFGTMKKFFKVKDKIYPKEKLPERTPVLAEFLKKNSTLKVIWFGHSTFLLNIDGVIILVDPVFSNSASPVSFLVERFQPPVLQLEQLPELDYLLVSHDHYDHLDMKTIKYFKDKNVKFILPLGVGEHLESWGVSKRKIFERGWWDTLSFEDEIEFIATPAQHFSGRGMFDRNKTLWASWVVRSKNHKVYFSGDTGYDVHFKEIGDRYGPFDVAFMENGQYNEKWKEVHMLPELGVKAFRDLKANKYFPVHWGMFVLSFHHWTEPANKILALSQQKKFQLVIPYLGEVVDLNQSYTISPWWTKVK